MSLCAMRCNTNPSKVWAIVELEKDASLSQLFFDILMPRERLMKTSAHGIIVKISDLLLVCETISFSVLQSAK
jgi:hypothetical protein